jgi:hypothetical protein
MPGDEYDTLLKAQLQRLAGKRGLDTSGTVAALRERLRSQDEQNAITAPGEDEDEEEDVVDDDGADDDFPEDEEVDEEEEAPAGDPDPVASDLEMVDPGDVRLKDGYFLHTVTAGNSLFFEDPAWHEANKEMALLEAQSAGFRYHPSMGKMEYQIKGNSVHYRFPVEKEE